MCSMCWPLNRYLSFSCHSIPHWMRWISYNNNLTPPSTPPRQNHSIEHKSTAFFRHHIFYHRSSSLIIVCRWWCWLVQLLHALHDKLTVLNRDNQTGTSIKFICYPGIACVWVFRNWCVCASIESDLVVNSMKKYYCESLPNLSTTAKNYHLLNHQIYKHWTVLHILWSGTGLRTGTRYQNKSKCKHWFDGVIDSYPVEQNPHINYK